MFVDWKTRGDLLTKGDIRGRDAFGCGHEVGAIDCGETRVSCTRAETEERDVPKDIALGWRGEERTVSCGRQLGCVFLAGLRRLLGSLLDA